eukprot:m51a1_g336 hypothetical protein (122) ;mRNA; r:503388-503829
MKCIASIIVAALVFAAVASAACDQAQITSCANEYQKCLSDAATDAAKAVCKCFPSYLGCLDGKGCPMDATITQCKAAFVDGNMLPCKADDICKKGDKGDKGAAGVAAPAVAAVTAALGLLC